MSGSPESFSSARGGSSEQAMRNIRRGESDVNTDPRNEFTRRLDKQQRQTTEAIDSMLQVVSRLERKGMNWARVAPS